MRNNFNEEDIREEFGKYSRCSEDDASMVAFCLSCVGIDLDKYRNWKQGA